MPLERVAVEFLDQPPAMHDPDPRGQPIDLAEDVARHEHRDAVLGGQLPDQLPDLDHPGRVEAVGGLVEHEQFRPGQQRPGEGETLQVAERERAGPPVGVGPERQPLDHRVHGAAVRHPRQAARDVEVVADAQFRVCGRALHEMADPPPEARRAGR